MKSFGIFVFISLAVVLSSISSSECRYMEEEGSRMHSCEYMETYFAGKCYEACNFRANMMNTHCVENAYCHVIAAHTATCSCLDGYAGDATHGVCSKVN